MKEGNILFEKWCCFCYLLMCYLHKKMTSFYKNVDKNCTFLNKFFKNKIFNEKYEIIMKKAKSTQKRIILNLII